MKLREIIRYEIEHRVRSASTWIYVVIQFLAAMWMFLATADGGGAHINAPERIAGASVAAAMFGMLITAALFGDAAVRDVRVEMDPLLFTSPIRKVEYLGGRFLAAYAVNAVVLIAIPLGLMAATWLASSFETVGPFRVSAFIQPWFLFLLPNLAVVGAILFATGIRTRHVVPLYLSAIALFILYIVALNHAEGISIPTVAALADPFGLVSMMHVTRYWPAADRNTQLVGLPALLLWNRAFWLAIAAGVFGLLVYRFRFAHAAAEGRRQNQRVATPVHERIGPVAVPRVAGTFGARTTLRQTLAITRQSLAEPASSRWFVVVLLACTFLPMLWGWNVGDSVFETSTWPVTLLVAETVLSSRSVLLITLLIAIYSGELVWRDRETGTAEISDASPWPDGIVLLGRFIALVAMLVMFQVAFMIGGILIQVFQGYYHFEPLLYVEILFGLNLIEFMVIAVLAMTIHVVVNHKYIGHMVVLLAFVAPHILRELRLVRHNLLLYGMDPGWTYSDMNGFGPFIGPFVWFKLYWGAWALLLGVAAVVLWVRGREEGIRRRLRHARVRLAGHVMRTAAVAIVLILGFGGFIFYNTNILNAYVADGVVQAQYEKRYARFLDVPQPTISDAALHVEIHPDEMAVDLRGTYRLINRTDVSIDSVHVYINPIVDTRSLTFDRAAQSVLTDGNLGYRIYTLDQPLEPGASMRLEFDVGFRQRGFTNSRLQTQVVANGAYFDRRWLPFIGYQPIFELSGIDERARFDLEPQPPLAELDDVGARARRSGVRNEDLASAEMVIGTTADQIAITTGVLRREWMENGRRYFHYEAEVPSSFSATVFSAAYAVHEDRWNDVALSIYHHPDHGDNLDNMVRSMKASLDYYTTRFGPYKGNVLRIVEIPRYGQFGRAHPQTIAFTEDFMFTRPKADQFDQLFFGTAHEVAHMWWPGQAQSAAGVRGAPFLSESLANFSAMLVTEATFGPEAADKIYAYQMDRYLRQRAAQARDVPLLEVTNQPWIHYGKGAVALYTLREHTGEDAVDTALRRYLEKHSAEVPPYATSLDLYNELRAVTPDSMKYLLTDLFETVTLWEVRPERAVVEQTGSEYRVTLDVVARKMRADSIGSETEVPMNDLVEIGVFAAGEDCTAPLYLQRHRIHTGEQSITVVVPREPARAGIDPCNKLIDPVRDDNIVDVEQLRPVR